MSAESYIWFKWFHILAAILFIGNMVVTAWWKYAADKTRDPKIISFAVKQLMTTDKIFTFPSVMILFGTGMAGAMVMGVKPAAISWVYYGMLLFIFSGLLWFIALLPMQLRMRTITMHLAPDEPVPDHYWKLSMAWNFVGAIATALPIISSWYMVFKPL